MTTLGLLRMRTCAQHPPGWRRVPLVACVVLTCLARFAVERRIGLPGGMAADPRGAGRLP